MNMLSPAGVVAPVPARAAPLQQPSFIPLASKAISFSATYAVDDDLALSHNNLHPIRPSCPIPGSASDHILPPSLASTSSSTPHILHHPSTSIAHIPRSGPYPVHAPRLAHARHHAPSTSCNNTSCPMTPSTSHVPSAIRPSASLSSPGVPSPAYPAGFYPTPLPSPPRRTAHSTLSPVLHSLHRSENLEMDGEPGEHTLAGRHEHEDAFSTSRLPPHLSRSLTHEQAEAATDSLPSFHDLLQSIHGPESDAVALQPAIIPISVVEKEVCQTRSPMDLLFTPVSNSTMAYAMEGLDVERLAGEVDSVMNTRSW